MITTIKLQEIRTIIEKYEDIEYRIINNTIGKNLILLNLKNEDLLLELKEYDKYIQEIIFESNENEDKLFIKEIKSICENKNDIAHRNISYINWNRKSKIEKINNVISGYSFKGGMGRSSTLAYLSYFYYLLGKKVVVLDCDFEAPGIASMFFERETRETKAGVLDYLIDLNIENEPKLDNYFMQSEVSDNSGNLYLFPSGIDFDIDNYINKISKIDFNSQTYTSNFIKLLKHIENILKPDLIFVDLRAGLNESNGAILKNISDTNLLFFNSEEQNEDGLKIILNLLDNTNDNIIMNSTIRYSDTTTRKIYEDKLNLFLKDIFPKFDKSKNILVPHKTKLLENNINTFKMFVEDEQNKSSEDFYIKDIIKFINNKYIKDEDISIGVFPKIVDDKSILSKLKEAFSKLTAKESFKDNNLEYFYLKDDISTIINEQIFLILGAKGSGKSTLFEVFIRHHKDILKNLNTNNNNYIEGFSEDIKSEISDDYILKLNKISNEKADKKRFWKCLTLFQLENKLDIKDRFFIDIIDISNKFNDIDIGLEVDDKLKKINIKLLEDEQMITLVYDELDSGFIKENEIYIQELISFWQDNIYKYSNVRSKILLRTDIFDRLDILNRTHLELNKYELIWKEKEILSLILKIFIAVLSEDELEKINLLDIVKNKKNKEVIYDIDKIRKAIYFIFNKRVSVNRPTMDKWIMTRLSDAKGLITPRVIYKFMAESISMELSSITKEDKKYLLTSFTKNWENILSKVSNHKRDEYNEEFKDNTKIYEKIRKIGQRSFTFAIFKKQYSKITDKTVKNDLNKLVKSGFINYNEISKKYQVAYIYTYGLGLKINRSKTKQEDD
ncbi:MAG: AAA family ATPase [Sulfurovum sp.]